MSPAVPLLALAASLIAGSAAAAPGALYERAFMLEADRRCVLFTPEIRTALEVAAAQASAAERRAGRDPGLARDRARAGARSTPCASADLRTAAARVRDAHGGWRRIQRLDFPGPKSVWKADRTPAAALRWRLVQSHPAAAFGLAGDAPGALRPYAVARFPKRARPALARLTVGRRSFLAETNAPAPEGLKPAGRGAPAWAFRFPQAAIAALDAAGPGDLVRLDFVTPGRERDRAVRVVIERGDYAAARAFIRL